MGKSGEEQGDSAADTQGVSRRDMLKGVAGAGGVIGVGGASAGIGRRHPAVADTFPYLSGRVTTECDPIATRTPYDGETGEPWTIAVITDTQYYAQDPDLTGFAEAQAEWIVDNKEEENIAFVTYAGDLVHNGDDADQWNRIEDVIDILDGEVPYGTVPGNHDWAVTWDKTSSIEEYVDRFGADRFDGKDWYGGVGPDGLSHYQYISAGDTTMIHLGLEWEPREAALDWAQEDVLDAHPDMPAWVTTHAYLTDRRDTEEGFPWDRGRIDTVREKSGETPSHSAEEVYQEFIRPNDQIIGVFCGHKHGGRIPWNKGEYRQVARHDDGIPVYEFQSNYQGRENGGNGFMRLYTITPGGGSCDAAPDRLEVRTYSPTLDAEQRHLPSEFAYEFDLSVY